MKTKRNIRSIENDPLVVQNPDIVVKIGIVGHGFQIDVFNYSRATKDGNGVEHTCCCRDFGGTYDVAEIADAAAKALIDAMILLERDKLREIFD